MYLFFSKSKASFSRINFSQQLSNCDVSDGWDTQASLRGNTTTTLLWKEKRGQWDAIIPDLGKRFQPSIRSYFQIFPMLLLGGIGDNLKIRSLTSLQIQNRRKNMLFFKKQNNKTKRGQNHAHPGIFFLISNPLLKALWILRCRCYTYPSAENPAWSHWSRTAKPL